MSEAETLALTEEVYQPLSPWVPLNDPSTEGGEPSDLTSSVSSALLPARSVTLARTSCTPSSSISTLPCQSPPSSETCSSATPETESDPEAEAVTVPSRYQPPPPISPPSKESSTLGSWVSNFHWLEAFSLVSP